MKIFYSWQSELPNSTNRGFIEEALEKAVKAIRKDDSINIEPVIDRDTQGVPGSPDIVETIFSKIDSAAMFVCDVSLITRRAQTDYGKEIRPTPNPNVLAEFGYALKSLGWRRIITVVNEAYGKADELPFDLRQKRAVVYKLTEADREKAPERNELAKALEAHIRTIIPEFEQQAKITIPAGPSPFDLALTAIQTNTPNQEAAVGDYMKWLVDEIVKINPDLSGNNDLDKLFLEALDKSEQLVIEFSKIVKSIAAMNAIDTAKAIYKGFELILQYYDPGSPLKRVTLIREFDLFRFLGYEFFVTFISALMQNNRWNVIAELLENDLFIYSSNAGKPKLEHFTILSDYVRLFREVNFREGSEIQYIYSEILRERHNSGDLGKIVSLQEFIDTDFFLLLRSVVAEKKDHFKWWSWSTKNMIQLPRFLIEAGKKKNAEKLLAPLGVGNIETLRSNFEKELPKIGDRFNQDFRWDQLEKLNPQDIGSK